MSTLKKNSERVFKTAWFSKATKKARIRDAELCAAIRQTMQGQAVDLGGGVFKKRLNNNMHRTIILAKGSHYWVYEFIFAKKDRDNIRDDELAGFRQLAKNYQMLTPQQMNQLVRNGAMMEICHDNEA